MAATLLMSASTSSLAISLDAITLADTNSTIQQVNSGALRNFDSLPPFPASSKLAPEYPSTIVHANEAYPDVHVLPVRVAGTNNVAAKKNLANKIAQVAESGSIAVIYPDIGEPYRSVFTQIIEGIKDKANKRHVDNFAVGPNVDMAALNNFLREQNTKVVIALGRQGVKVASTLDSNIGVVMGGVLTATENEVRDHQVNCLSPDPSLLFSRLKGLMPKARRVFTVYDPRQNAWMMRLARAAAREQGLELTAYEAQDLRSAMHAYQEIFAAADSSQDALWLPQDSTSVEDSAILPMVLQESWAHNLAVFSSSFGHVRRGVLFSLYPNNIELGRHLAGSALDYLTYGESGLSGMLPLREVLMAVNLRTAKHLGLNTGHPENFDMAFPEQ